MSPDRLTVGSYGVFHFRLKRKFRTDPRKSGTKLHNTTIETGFTLDGTVESNEEGHILVRDKEGIIYIPRKKDVDVFHKLTGEESAEFVNDLIEKTIPKTNS